MPRRRIVSVLDQIAKCPGMGDALLDAVDIELYPEHLDGRAPRVHRVHHRHLGRERQYLTFSQLRCLDPDALRCNDCWGHTEFTRWLHSRRHQDPDAATAAGILAWAEIGAKIAQNAAKADAITSTSDLALLVATLDTSRSRYPIGATHPVLGAAVELVDIAIAAVRRKATDACTDEGIADWARRSMGIDPTEGDATPCILTVGDTRAFGAMESRVLATYAVDESVPNVAVLPRFVADALLASRRYPFGATPMLTAPVTDPLEVIAAAARLWSPRREDAPMYRFAAALEAARTSQAEGES